MSKTLADGEESRGGAGEGAGRALFPRALSALPVQICIILLLGAAAYSNSLGGGFIWDDRSLIRDNVYIRDWRHLFEAFSGDVAAGSSQSYGFYRPLQVLSYMVDFSFGGLNVAGYHLVNLALHLGVSTSLLFLARQILSAYSLAPFFTALLFAVHPVHTETVNYLSNRGDLLGALFLLLSFLLYLGGLEKGGPWRHPAAGLLFSLSLLSKEFGVVLPGLILAYHAAFRKRVPWPAFSIFLAVDAAYLLLRILFLPGAALHGDFLLTVPGRAPGVFAAVTNYVGLLLLPVGLHMEYGPELFSWGDPQVVAGMALTAAIAAAALLLRGRAGVLSFPALWFLLALLPVSNLYPVAFFMAEHYLYLPSVGFFLLLGHLCGVFFRRTARAALVAVGCLTLLWGVMTFRQNRYWESEETFFETTLKYYPGSARVMNSLAMVYYEQKRYGDAMGMYERALAVTPGYPYPYNNMGVIMNELGRYEEAAAYFKKALSIEPGYGDARHNLGLALQRLGRLGEAVGMYRQAVAVKPLYAGYRLSLADALREKGEIPAALEQYGIAIDLDPWLLESYFGMARALESAGDLPGAIGPLERVVALYPGSVDAHLQLARLYLALGNGGRSRGHYEEALRLGYAPPAPRSLPPRKEPEAPGR